MKPNNDQQLKKIFGEMVGIPRALRRVLDEYEVLAFSRDDVLTLYFPKLFNNQDLTIVYDKVWAIFPSSDAFRDAQDRRGIHIQRQDMERT